MDTKKAFEILERKNYARVSEKLAEASAEMARRVMGKMEELQIDELQTDYGTLIRFSRKSNSGYTADCLGWQDGFGDNEPGDLNSNVIGDGQEGFNYMGDWNCWIKYPTRKEVLTFAMNIDSILNELDKVESILSAGCCNALNKLNK